MTSRKNRLKKAIDSLEKRREEHLQKIEEENKKGFKVNEDLIDYWKEEVMTFTLEKKKREDLLKKAK